MGVNVFFTSILDSLFPSTREKHHCETYSHKNSKSTKIFLGMKERYFATQKAYTAAVQHESRNSPSGVHQVELELL